MKYIIVIFLFIADSCYSQDFNNLDSEGKKHGYWKTFVDQSFKEVDSLDATYFYYYYFHHGKRVRGVWKGKGWNLKKYQLEINGNKSKIGNVTILDGEYLFRSIKDTARYDLAIFKDGYLQILLEQFANPSFKRTRQKMDFTRKLNGNNASFYVENVSFFLDSSKGPYYLETGFYYIEPNSTKFKKDLKTIRKK